MPGGIGERPSRWRSPLENAASGRWRVGAVGRTSMKIDASRHAELRRRAWVRWPLAVPSFTCSRRASKATAATCREKKDCAFATSPWA